jgi:acetyl-CoA carboxylase biotin carboxyl carrier protein
MDGNDLKELRELVEFLKANSVAEFDMEREDLKVRLKFAGAEGTGAAAAGGGADLATLARLIAAQGAGAHLGGLGNAPAPVAALSPGQATPAAPAASAAAAAQAEEPHAGAHMVKSPIVGTFYGAPSPEAEPFVKLGDQVTAGKVLCIIEAMKLMNEIEADASGEIVKVFVQSGQPVEYGQPLFAIRA